jgi:hypothetical protein
MVALQQRPLQGRPGPSSPNLLPGAWLEQRAFLQTHSTPIVSDVKENALWGEKLLDITSPLW